MGLNSAPGLAAGGGVDFTSFQKERREGLTKFGSLTQDVIQAVNSTIKNAIASGQIACRVQTLHLSQHYSYSKVQPFPSTSLALHDDLTMEQFANVRINLAERARELVEWLEVQEGIQCICTSLKLKEELLFGMPSLAPHIYLVVILKPVPLGKAQFDKAAYENKVYNAIRCGSNVVYLFQMQRNKDYTFAKDGGSGNVKEFLTLKPVAEHITLQPHLNPVLEWIHEHAFDWFAAVQNAKATAVFGLILSGETKVSPF